MGLGSMLGPPSGYTSTVLGTKPVNVIQYISVITDYL